MKIIRNIRVADSPVSGYRRIRARDEILHAERLPRLIASTVWAGSLRPLVNTVVETLGQLVNGLSSGNVLHAEQLAGVLNEGRVWTGSLLGEVRSAVANSCGGRTVDVGETLREVERLDKLLRSAAPTSGAIADGVARLRRAADKVSIARTRDAVNPLTRLARITPEHRALGERLNQQARDFWAAQSAPSTSRAIGDSRAARTAAVRDQLAIAARARDTRTRMEALNRAASAFWART